jgi:hypothetical protein
MEASGKLRFSTAVTPQGESRYPVDRWLDGLRSEGEVEKNLLFLCHLIWLSQLMFCQSEQEIDISHGSYII